MEYYNFEGIEFGFRGRVTGQRKKRASTMSGIEGRRTQKAEEGSTESSGRVTQSHAGSAQRDIQR